MAPKSSREIPRHHPLRPSVRAAGAAGPIIRITRPGRIRALGRSLGFPMCPSVPGVRDRRRRRPLWPPAAGGHERLLPGSEARRGSVRAAGSSREARRAAGGRVQPVVPGRSSRSRTVPRAALLERAVKEAQRSFEAPPRERTVPVRAVFQRPKLTDRTQSRAARPYVAGRAAYVPRPWSPGASLRARCARRPAWRWTPGPCADRRRRSRRECCVR